MVLGMPNTCQCRNGVPVPDIRLQRPLKVPPVPAFAALKEILTDISSEVGAWRGFALHVALGDLHLPDLGYVSVPIALTIGETHPETNSVDIRFTSMSIAAAFPVFAGAAGIDATGPTGSTLWISGDYAVPLQVLGKLLDKTLGAGVAQRTLENLIEDLAVAVVANVEKREAEYARYRLH